MPGASAGYFVLRKSVSDLVSDMANNCWTYFIHYNTAIERMVLTHSCGVPATGTFLG